MAENKYIIQIPEPCSQNWHQMLPDQTGRFCTHCAHQVTDFSKMTDAEIIAVIEKSAGKVCGRVNNTDLDRVITKAPTPGKSNRLRQAVAAALLLLSGRQFVAGEPVNKQPILLLQSQNELPESAHPDNIDTSRQGLLKGSVLDSISRLPIEFASVKNLKTNKHCVTDTLGKFEIMASPGDTIEIQTLGYTTKKFALTNLETRSYLLEERMEMHTLGMMVTYRKPTVKEKIKRFFRVKYKPHYSS